MKKSFWEKLGDLLDHVGRRFLVGLVGSGVFGGLGMVFPPLVLLAIPCFFLMLFSFGGDSRLYYEDSITVTMPDGETVPCTIFKLKKHALFPLFPLNLVSLFNYIPYKVQYYLVPMPCTPQEKNVRLHTEWLGHGLLNAEEITWAERKALATDPSVAVPLLEKRAEYRRAFEEDSRRYVDTGLFTDAMTTPFFTVCRLDDSHLVFHYAGKDGMQRGFLFNGEKRDEICANPTMLMDAYLAGDVSDNMVVLTDELLEKLLKIVKTDKAEAAAETLEQIEKEKTPITKAMIETAVRGKLKAGATGSKWGGGILCFLAVGAFEIAIAFCIFFIFLAPVFAALGAWLLYKGIKIIKKGKANSRKEAAGEFAYRFVKTICTDVTVQTSDDGPDSYSFTFSDGSRIENHLHRIVSQGDVMYLVYINEEPGPRLWYNGDDYTVGDITPEDRT